MLKSRKVVRPAPCPSARKPSGHPVYTSVYQATEDDAYKTNNAWWLQEGSIPSVVLFSEPCSVDGIHLWVAWGTCPQFKKKKRVGLATVEVVAPSGVDLVGSTDGKKRWLALNFDNKEDLTN